MRAVEIGQNLFVKSNPVGDEGVTHHKCTQKPCLFGLKNAAQARVRELGIANKAEAFDFNNTTFGNFKHQIDTVVASADDIRSDLRCDTSFFTVGISNSCHIPIHLFRIKDKPDLGMDKGFEI